MDDTYPYDNYGNFCDVELALEEARWFKNHDFDFYDSEKW